MFRSNEDYSPGQICLLKSCLTAIMETHLLSPKHTLSDVMLLYLDKMGSKSNSEAATANQYALVEDYIQILFLGATCEFQMCY